MSMQSITSRTPYALASDAEVQSPDSTTSTGARFLERIRDAFLEVVERHADNPTTPTSEEIRAAVRDLQDDAGHEAADDAVPVYTHERWQVFVDLCAYEEDVSDFGDMDPANLTVSVAGVALYRIARRLIDTLTAELEEILDEL